jgi:hypothetical protein
MLVTDRRSGVMPQSRSQDPATRFAGPRPTDHDLPIDERTHSAPYLAAIVVVLIIGIALVAFAVVGFTESTANLDRSADAVAPTEQLAPESTGSLPATNRDAEDLPKTSGPTADDPAIAVPGAN